MCAPVSVPPVMVIAAMPGCDTSVSPMTEPRPVTTCAAPAGTPASCRQSTSRMMASGQSEGGLMITALPAASAGAILCPHSSTGKLNGSRQATTPTGSCRVTIISPWQLVASVPFGRETPYRWLALSQ